MHNHQDNDRERQLNKRGLSLAFGVTFIIMIAEVIGGFMSNSLALLSDAGHMFIDTLALGLSFWAVRMAQRPATHTKTYGYHRFEILAALSNGVLLMGISLWLFYEAFGRFFHPAPVKTGLMLTIAVVGMLANFTGIMFLRRSSSENLNVRGAFLHMLSDTFSSVGVIVGAVIMLFTGWYLVDPIISILLNGMIMRNALELVVESGDILLESTPRGIEVKAIADEVKKIEGVRDLHGLHIWTITSGIHALSGHLLIDDQLVSRGNEILLKVQEVLSNQFNITHTTLQLECEHCTEGLVCGGEK